MALNEVKSICGSVGFQVFFFNWKRLSKSNDNQASSSDFIGIDFQHGSCFYSTKQANFSKLLIESATIYILRCIHYSNSMVSWCKPCLVDIKKHCLTHLFVVKFVLSDFPQENHLDPILIVLFINDTFLASLRNASLLMYVMPTTSKFFIDALALAV